MKKIFTTLFCALFVLAGVAMADQPYNPGPGYYVKENGATAGTVKYFPNGHPENNSEWKFCGTDANSCKPTPPPCSGPGCYTSNYYKNFAATSDFSQVGTSKFDYSVSLWGWGNDKAFAGAEGGASAGFEAYAGGKGWLVGNGAWGTENTGSSSTADTYAADFGLTSIAGGYAAQNSFAESDALALGGGIGTGMAWTKTGGNVFGFVEQGNVAVEDWGLTYSEAGNHSAAGYSGSAYDAECYKGFGVWGAHSSVDLEGSAFTAGGSVANVDPFGNSQSSYGKTWNMAAADVKGADVENTFVAGQGSVFTGAAVGGPSNGGISNGGSVFGYEGSKFGAGVAEHSSYAEKGSYGNTNTATAGSNGFAGSFVKGATSVGQPQ